MHGLIVLDIGNGSKPVEVSRLKLSDEFYSHWTGWDAKTQRLVVTGWGEASERSAPIDSLPGCPSSDQNPEASFGGFGKLQE
jgi:hypothetical protein